MTLATRHGRFTCSNAPESCLAPVGRLVIPIVLSALVVGSYESECYSQPKPPVAAPPVLPKPTAPAPKLIEETEKSPMYYRLPDDTQAMMFRWALGGNIGLSGKDKSEGAFSLDVILGRSFGFGRGARWAAVTEVGYSYVGFGEHLGLFGAGLYCRKFGPGLDYRGQDPRASGLFSFALIPHFAVASYHDNFALGVRTDAVLSMYIVALTVSHQYLRSEVNQGHELHLAFTGFYDGYWLAD